MGVASTVAMTAGRGLFGDLRLAVRSLLRTPGFTAVAVLAMAVGIGGTLFRRRKPNRNQQRAGAR
jgi:hypothetical protein